MRSTTQQRVERPISKDALPSLDASLPRVLADLEGLGVEGLHRQWRNHLGGEAPVHLPRWLLLRVLVYRLQAAVHGDIDKATRRKIDAEQKGSVGAPLDRRDPQTREGVGLKPGTLLVREWQSKLERVMVLDQGFAWNGKTYGSLSQIAKAMTGTSWNGHRFFGLRQGRGSKREGSASKPDGEARPGRRPAKIEPRKIGEVADSLGRGTLLMGGKASRNAAAARGGGRNTKPAQDAHDGPLSVEAP